MSHEAMPRIRARRMALARGFSLIELMIAMVIALLFTIAIGQVMTTTEGSRRSSVSVGDIDQVGAYTIYQLDKLIRSAGVGLVHSRALSFGCQINAAKAGANILPTPALPAPFSGILGTITAFRVAPVVIVYNGSGYATGKSDTLILMSGASGFGDVDSTFLSAPTEDALTPSSVVGFSNPKDTSSSSPYNVAGDLVLLVDQPSGTTVHDCLVEQVTPGTDTSTGGNSLPLDTAKQSDPSYYTVNGSTVSLSGGFTLDGAAVDLGNPAASTAPVFQLIGALEGSPTTDYSLYNYDLLGIRNAGNASAVADGVFEIHALYQVDTANPASGLPDTWVSPNPATTIPVLGVSYDASATAGHLLDGSTTSADALYRIKAIRLGVILRTSLLEKDIVSPDKLNLFQDLTDANGDSLQYTRDLSKDDAERHYRYRTLEVTIPVRNNYYNN